jgi:hypothetical protein
MFFAEFATAVTGWVLEINPFDQPNVQEAKDNTKKVLDSGDFTEPPTADRETLDKLLDTGPPHYVAIMAYVTPSAEVDKEVAEVRKKISERSKCATTFGYGPRFLHSTGQFHKGGPPNGVFIQVVATGDEDVEIPGEDYSFKVLKHAQAIGDYKTLEAHDLPVARVNSIKEII